MAARHMARPQHAARRNSSHPVPLDRERLVGASLRLLEQVGAEAFSMRGLAAALGIKSPSLYWHVKSKQELLDLVVDHVLGTCPAPNPGAEHWPDALAEFTRQLRNAILGHPGVAPLLVGRIPLGPNGLRLADSCLGLLRNAGFDEVLAADAYTILVFYAAGFAIQEITFGRGPQARAQLRQVRNMLAALPASQYPNLTAAAHAFAAPGRLNERFELGLADHIQGLQNRLSSH